MSWALPKHPRVGNLPTTMQEVAPAPILVPTSAFRNIAIASRIQDDSQLSPRPQDVAEKALSLEPIDQGPQGPSQTTFEAGRSGRPAFVQKHVDELSGQLSAFSLQQVSGGRPAYVFGGPVFTRAPPGLSPINNTNTSGPLVASPSEALVPGKTVLKPTPQPRVNPFIPPLSQTTKPCEPAILVAPAKDTAPVAEAASRPLVNLISLSPVDKFFRTVPSLAHLHPKYKIQVLDAYGRGGMSTTYRAQLVYNTGALGPLVFAKLVRKASLKATHHTEVRAYARLDTATPNYLGKPLDLGQFVAKLQAFADRLFDPEATFLFELHICDMARAVNPGGRMFEKAKDNFRLWLAQSAAGIHHLHSIGIIHRDIKPNNVLIDWRYNARVTDLGLAWVSPEPIALRSTQNYAHLDVGTSYYKAPEVIVQSANVCKKQHRANDPSESNPEAAAYGLKVDWWSYGMMVYEVASVVYGPPGWEPTAQDLPDLMEARKRAMIIRRQPPQAGVVDPWVDALSSRGIPKELHDLLGKVLAVWPKERAGFTAISSDSYFDKGLQRSIFYDLPAISSAREITKKPKSLFAKRQAKNITISVELYSRKADPDIFSWICTETSLFGLPDN